MDAIIFLLSGVAIGYGIRSCLKHSPMLSIAGAMVSGPTNVLARRNGRISVGMLRDSVIANDVVDSVRLDVPTASHVHPFPTLASIDQAMNSPQAGFADHFAAPMLEQHARELVEMYWSDSVWLTGMIDDASLAVVVAALEADRSAGVGFGFKAAN